MLHFLSMTKLTLAVTGEERDRIQQILSQNNIKYKIKASGIYKKNPIDEAHIGSFGINRVKPTYTFYVEKNSADYALHLIHS